MATCPNCHEPVFPEDQFCGVCGNPIGGSSPPTIPPPTISRGVGILCPTCGMMNESDALFCERDGTQLPRTQGTGEPTPIIERPPIPPPISGLFVMPDQSELPLPVTMRVFGRTDFLRYVKPENAKEVSRVHFTVTQDNGVFFIQDGGPDPNNPQAWKASVNKTSVNGVLLQPGVKQRLNPNDVIDVAQLGLNLVFKTK